MIERICKNFILLNTFQKYNSILNNSPFLLYNAFKRKLLSPRRQCERSEYCLLPVLNLLKAFQTIPTCGIVWFLHLSPTYESKLSTLSQNEETPTLCVEALWSRQDWHKLAANKINCGPAQNRTGI